MNPFGQELRKILTQCKTSGVVSYAGRSAYIQLDPDLRARLEFVSLNIAGQYNALKLTMNVLAAGMEISDEDLKTLRARSVREVKQTNGRISFKDAIDYQRGVE